MTTGIFINRRSTAGQSAVEFALIVPIFLLLVFGVMDFGRLLFVQENVQQAINLGARYASTGIHQSGTDPKTGQPYSRVGSIGNYILQQASVSTSMGATLAAVQISSVLGGASNAGGPQDLETVAVTTTVPLMTPVIANFFPNRQFVFTSSATIKNEPFPPGQTN
jgi:Flp pilus assembly protein TadG